MLSANLLTKIKLAKDTMQFDFELVSGELTFQAGQYLSIKLPKVRAQGDEGNVRYFSLVSSPNENKKFSIATRLSSSAYKQYLFGMSLGEVVDVGGVSGDMILPSVAEQPLVFLAGGIGITPFMSMLSFIKENKTGHKVTLLYTNRNRSASAYFDDLEKHVSELADFKFVATMTDDEYWPAEKRMIDYEFIKEYVPMYKEVKYFVAGPPSFVLAAANNFDRLGIGRENFILEEFFGY